MMKANLGLANKGIRKNPGTLGGSGTYEDG